MNGLHYHLQDRTMPCSCPETRASRTLIAFHSGTYNDHRYNHGGLPLREAVTVIDHHTRGREVCHRCAEPIQLGLYIIWFGILAYYTVLLARLGAWVAAALMRVLSVYRR